MQAASILAVSYCKHKFLSCHETQLKHTMHISLGMFLLWGVLKCNKTPIMQVVNKKTHALILNYRT